MGQMKRFAETEAEMRLAGVEIEVMNGKLSLTEARDKLLKMTCDWKLIGFHTIDELEEYLCTETAFKTIQ